MIPWSVNRNPDWNPDKSIGILIGTRTNQSKSQSEPGQSIPHAVTAHGMRAKNYWSHVGLGKIYITHSKHYASPFQNATLYTMTKEA